MEAIIWNNYSLKLLDQTKLPGQTVYNRYTTYQEVADAIKDMIVRGAPAIGIVAAYGVVLGAAGALRTYIDIPNSMPNLNALFTMINKNENSEKETPLKFEEQLDFFLSSMNNVFKVLSETRPTAVNLFWALERMKKTLEESLQKNDFRYTLETLEKEAVKIHDEDVENNTKLSNFGKELIKDGSKILTHCNAGRLATGGYGTALGVIRAAFESGKNISVIAGETRPFLQGARLTVYELMQDNVPVTLITDNMAAQCMKEGKIDMIIVGADRIAANGDTANKIGTYSLAVLAKAHNIPFYVAAPFSTIDLETLTGDSIIIEERSDIEIKFVGTVQVAPYQAKVYNPSFDVTPNELIHAIITEKGIIYPSFDVNVRKMKENN